jgi:hypothetical protein
MELPPSRRGSGTGGVTVAADASVNGTDVWVGKGVKDGPGVTLADRRSDVLDGGGGRAVHAARSTEKITRLTFLMAILPIKPGLRFRFHCKIPHILSVCKAICYIRPIFCKSKFQDPNQTF